MGKQRQLGATRVYLRAGEVEGVSQHAEANCRLKGAELGRVLQLGTTEVLLLEGD